MTAWLFDLGNTRLKCAPLVDGDVGDVHALPHASGELAAALAAVLPPRIDVAYVASVAGEALRVELLDALTARCARIELARTQRVFAGLRIAYATPARLGVDRFLAMLGARRHERGPVLVCGVGTALTIDLVDADGLHRGGRIAPSPDLMREALHQRAPQLPLDGGDWVDWADDTVDALASGCLGAALTLIRDAQQSATTTLGIAPTLLLHGGGATPLLARLPEAREAGALVLDGLAVWATT
ncbi:type III pantothenate kinase [Lysobacter sp. TY2-98]|uniref:type III pantothenate kinase n=1 Tax=Lysobacter sp. TY2-98 TaxID=2290922 RepID=UPI000E204CB5|nr:type III pantothenate kinase [Lysobacter sp. TY2-98]AXK72871.1 type III pantothenate kinase [Lysobacter sp. TY2-98]